jgi:hypothetical protein
VHDDGAEFVRITHENDETAGRSGGFAFPRLSGLRVEPYFQR